MTKPYISPKYKIELILVDEKKTKGDESLFLKVFESAYYSMSGDYLIIVEPKEGSTISTVFNLSHIRSFKTTPQ